MPCQIQIYRLEEFARFSESGTLDVERSKELIRKIVAASSARSIDRILVDLRKTTVEADRTFADILDIAAEFTRWLPVFHGKVANVIPADPNRVAMAQQLKNVAGVDSSVYEIFTTFEDAIDWLSEIEEDRTYCP